MTSAFYSLLLGLFLAIPATADERAILKVFPTSDSERTEILRSHTPLAPDPEADHLVIEATADDRKQLQRSGIAFLMDGAATDRMAAEAAKVISGYQCYRDVEEIYARVDELAVQFPALATRIDIGQSWRMANGLGGNRLTGLRISGPDSAASPLGDRSHIVINGGIHGREYATAELVLQFAEQLLNNAETDATTNWLLAHRIIHIIAPLNPDGRKNAQTGVLWRKNANTRHCGAGPAPGVDLNRNFSFGWGGFNGSSGDECAEDYRGPAPASEPETQALADYLLGVFGDSRPSDLTSRVSVDTPGMFLDVHSFGRLLLHPWGFEGVPIPNNLELNGLSRKLAWFNGYLPSATTGLYPVDGSTTSYSYGELGVASMIFEVGDTFFEPCSNFPTILDDNLPALTWAALAADQPYRHALNSELADLVVQPGIVETGEQFTVRVVSTTGQISPIGPTLAIADAIEVDIAIEAENSDQHVGTLSLPVTNGIALGDVATDELPPGRYRIVGRTVNSDGIEGVPMIRWLNVVEPGTTALITGEVRSATDNRPVDGTVSVGDTQVQTDPLSGQFWLRVPPGNAELIVASPGFSALTPVILATDANDVVAVGLTPQPFVIAYANDFETELDGWQLDGTWALTDGDSFEGNSSLTDSPGGNYAPDSAAAARTPAMDLSPFKTAIATLSYRCEAERTMDFGRIITVRNQTGFLRQQLACTGNQPEWRRAQFDLDQYAGFNNIFLNFRMDSDSQVNGDGFYIDSLEVLGDPIEAIVANSSSHAFSGALTGTWFDPALAGQGMVFEIGETSAGPVLIAAWYTYQDGEPLWLIGSTPIGYTTNQATVPLFSASGANFGTEFDPAAVSLIPWGNLTIEVSSRNNITADYIRSTDAQSGQLSLIPLTSSVAGEPRLVTTGLSRGLSGTWFDTNASGQGVTLEIGENDEGDVAIVTWYTFIDGQPLWLIGSTPIDPSTNQIEVAMTRFSGTGFGPQFDPHNVVGESAGTLRLNFSDCQSALLTFDGLGEEDYRLNLVRLTDRIGGAPCIE